MFHLSIDFVRKLTVNCSNGMQKFNKSCHLWMVFTTIFSIFLGKII